MVNLVENWEVLEDYAGDKRGFYQILGDAEAFRYFKEGHTLGKVVITMEHNNKT